MTGLERLTLEIVAALFLVWGTVLYLEHRGAAACREADAVAVTRQEARNAAQAADDTQLIHEEAQAYAQTLSAPDPIDVPDVRLCHYPAAAVPQAAPARPGAPAAAANGATNPPVAEPDLGPPLVKLGRNADAQVRALQAYIREVCLN